MARIRQNKDHFGISWQTVPAALDEIMRNGTRDQIDRLTRAFLGMKRLDMAVLRTAYAVE